MPRPFHQLTLQQFLEALQGFSFTRQIDAVHMHHTWLPDRSMYRGLASIESMYEFHTVQNGWSDIAQHITIAPDGTVWTGRNWNDPPASSTGYNGNRTVGPFMFEMIGDFDLGKDPFDGPQRDTALAVVAAVQDRFHLPLDSLRFHNQMSPKTCPGSSIKRDDVLKAVDALRRTACAAPAARAPAQPMAISATGVRDDEMNAESNHGQERMAATPAGRGFSAADLAALRPYVVSMRQGHWDTSGIFNSTSGDVDAIFLKHAKAAIENLPPGKKLKFVLYAHGGLVSEQHGLEQAQMHINWWLQSQADGIYPVYFVWKTGLAETIGQILGLWRPESADAAALESREFFTDPLIAGLARRLGGEGLWTAMKSDAEQAVASDGAATYFALQLKAFCDRYPGRVELHAVGHSAGAVFHSHFIPKSTVLGNDWFKTTSFLAPAVRVDTFLSQLAMPDNTGALHFKAEIGQLAIFTMKKEFEKADDCRGIYRQSLLYLIYHAFEPADKTPILGLEECIRADARLTTLLGLSGNAAGNAEVIWSKSPSTSGRSASQAVHHGDFSSDAPSLNSILRRVLDVSDAAPIHEFPSGARALTASWDIWQAPDDLPGFTPSVPVPLVSRPAAPAAPATPPSGRRRALCVGIDAYASPNRLTGCVNDAHVWASTLSAFGFSTQTLLDEAATYNGIYGALTDLVKSSQAGDVIVFQYSGHGTTVPDTTGRTINGVEEAMVPVDFSAAHAKLLMDFELGQIFDLLPPGVNLTCFIDCCHSGTITRLFVGFSATVSRAGADAHPRFLQLTPAEIAAVQRNRGPVSFGARGMTVGGAKRMKDIAFTACQPEEVAWESDGHGVFTLHATSLLQSGIGGLTNQKFADAVVLAFGADTRQHPRLDCVDAVRTRPLLQPLPGA